MGETARHGGEKNSPAVAVHPEPVEGCFDCRSRSARALRQASVRPEHKERSDRSRGKHSRRLFRTEVLLRTGGVEGSVVEGFPEREQRSALKAIEACAERSRSG